MPYRGASTRQDRTVAIAAVVLVHAAIGAMLLTRTRSELFTPPDQPPVLIDIREPPPPPPPPPPRPQRDQAKHQEGAAGKKGEPTPLVAPKPAIVVPAKPPVTAAPAAGTGSSPNPGNANAGSGPGAGGSGSGRGAGGGGGSAAQWISGGLRDSDYPRDALMDRMVGTVRVRFTVLASGRIGACRIVRSSGSGELDDVTCRLLTQRLRFRPATDAGGRPIASDVWSDYTWGIRSRR